MGSMEKLSCREDEDGEAISPLSLIPHPSGRGVSKVFLQCPGAVLTAIVYLSIAQEKDVKYNLLHKATYLMFSTPDLNLEGWPVKDELIRTLYANSEGQKPVLELPKKLRAPVGIDRG